MNNDIEQIPRSEWGDGPWQNEPDRLEWRYKGFPCLMVRNIYVTAAWCGYVAVPPGHPAFERYYMDIEVDVHGGLTYGDHCRAEICHVPQEGESDDVYWLGFDCAHCFDIKPILMAALRRFSPAHSPWPGEKYWTQDMVHAEVERLADQLAEMAKQ